MSSHVLTGFINQARCFRTEYTFFTQTWTHSHRGPSLPFFRSWLCSVPHDLGSVRRWEGEGGVAFTQGRTGGRGKRLVFDGRLQRTLNYCGTLGAWWCLRVGDDSNCSHIPSASSQPRCLCCIKHPFVVCLTKCKLASDLSQLTWWYNSLLCESKLTYLDLWNIQSIVTDGACHAITRTAS